MSRNDDKGTKYRDCATNSEQKFKYPRERKKPNSVILVGIKNKKLIN